MAGGSPLSVSSPYVLKYLPHSTAFCWSREATTAVWLASKSLPLTARFQRELFPDGLRNCWWWLEWPLPIPMKDRHTFDATEFANQVDVQGVSALLLAYDDSGLLIICDGRQTAVAPLMTGLLGVPPDASLQELLDGQAMDPQTGALVETKLARGLDVLRFVMAASVWLQQRIVVMSGGHVERHRRKQLAREHDAPVPSDVKVIQLRRPESDTRIAAGAPESVEWSCRWVVNGHWRNQIYANGRHELDLHHVPYAEGSRGSAAQST